jgi:hypothetical protein
MSKNIRALTRGIFDLLTETEFFRQAGGAYRDRTDDLKLAKLPLSQLS